MYVLFIIVLFVIVNKSFLRGGWILKKNIFFVYSNVNFAKWSLLNLKIDSND